MFLVVLRGKNPPTHTSGSEFPSDPNPGSVSDTAIFSRRLDDFSLLPENVASVQDRKSGGNKRGEFNDI